MTIVSKSPAETLEVGRRIGAHCKPGTVISLRGSLGAGKTVIAKGVAEALGITEAIVSPTFTLIQEYQGKTLRMYHMDLYRLSGTDEFEMIGGEEMLYGKAVTLIEWSEKIQEMLPKNTVYVNLEIQPNQERVITIQGMEL
ncbi:MAG: tRNA (adenosine(37)-N6)-threonylcarbamoyltransferase complex ATPase subunit type 1 TsaE [Sphaerochaeta sp.]|jgi:tRNA threonylcarbamoyladenosine biosynthesis protein TsaE|nr:tRNA (adenosine(37)-N6)-threonylcarbamoyltransferase complex ATPase subunit type 1 TsaE [Sphaerochaeta sp.]MCH3920016.1 tRNA (adenosine(37)-N6)-threonylcarbamoyltransferase complex ATPase subunit type 1 TsaE [Sphaerochaeta sp.]MCI2045279.1 tRNA (adenosine(37)-N6)-threonylcarbamoyltransferase complex ATPase subunit type 1 TsaE [Sphaerochaeta sp.]MCI2076966.1 tRNA (adenosine(37)-N6)-threonylcarbamoyltransferase complex ATPase subunit type 1 TsaE [Sphaerochaeta sp.]MCI2097023.1 tRNA (adenosine(